MAFVFAEGIRLAHKVGALAAEKKTSRFPGRNRKLAGRFPEADEPFVTKKGRSDSKFFEKLLCSEGLPQRVDS